MCRFRMDTRFLPENPSKDKAMNTGGPRVHGGNIEIDSFRPLNYIYPMP